MKAAPFGEPRVSGDRLRDVSTARRLHYNYDDYLGSLEASELKLEFCDGVIYAMAGGTRAHAELAARAIVALARAVPPSCRIATSDLKVRVDSSDLTTFPDVSVVCGEPIMAAIDPNALTNPTVLVEVTSRSTEDYDRGDKLSHYKQLPSLRAVLFVSHRTRCVTVVERTANDPRRWDEREARGGETITLASPAITIPVDELYDGIALDLV
jgi:Uma2 family endonuclease